MEYGKTVVFSYKSLKWHEKCLIVALQMTGVSGFYLMVDNTGRNSIDLLIMKIVNDVTPQGNVEAWLGLLLDGVRKTIHNIIRQAHMVITDQGFKLEEFQSMFPAQVGLLGIQLIWTRDAEEALCNSKTDKKV